VKKMLKLLTAVVFGIMFMGISTAMASGNQNRGGDKDLTYELDDTEIHHLLFIREEEKMARDVYRVLYEKGGNPIFANIEESEQAHMDAMANLLTFYGIDDPVTNDVTGEFTNEDIAGLYSYLVAWGLESEFDALLVGAYIEEYDILDIWEAYAETDEERIQTVYQNLYEGSYNHLRSFVYVFELVTDESYENNESIEKLLTDVAYNDVMIFETQANQAHGKKE
jgi:hypothetical protein